MGAAAGAGLPGPCHSPGGSCCWTESAFDAAAAAAVGAGLYCGGEDFSADGRLMLA